MDTQRTIFIVGGAGYIGEMLCDLFNAREDVRTIVALDKEPQSDFSKSLQKVVYVQSNMADDGWQEIVAKYEPDTVIHTAWQIRALYGNEKEQWRWNVEGSGKVFDFAFTQPSVRKLVYFSTASSYSARKDNTFAHYFTEEEGFRDHDYIYAKEKKSNRGVARAEISTAAQRRETRASGVRGSARCNYRSPRSLYAHPLRTTVSFTRYPQRRVRKQNRDHTYFVCSGNQRMGSSVHS